jgi:hypothetical protein
MMNLFIGVIIISMEETMALLDHELAVNTRAAELAKKSKYSHVEIASLREMFDAMDADGSHSISSDELFSAVVRSGVNISNKVIEQSMARHTVLTLRYCIRSKNNECTLYTVLYSQDTVFTVHHTLYCTQVIEQLMTKVDIDKSGELDFADFVGFVVAVRGGMVQKKHRETGAIVKIHHTEFHNQEEAVVQMSVLEEEIVRMKEFLETKGLSEEYQEIKDSHLVKAGVEAIRTAHLRDEFAITRIQKIFRGNHARADMRYRSSLAKGHRASLAKGGNEATAALATDTTTEQVSDVDLEPATAAGLILAELGLKAAAAPASATHSLMKTSSASNPFTKEHSKENNDASWIEQHATKKETDDDDKPQLPRASSERVWIGGAKGGAGDPVANMQGQKVMV